MTAVAFVGVKFTNLIRESVFGRAGVDVSKRNGAGSLDPCLLCLTLNTNSASFVTKIYQNNMFFTIYIQRTFMF